MRSITIFTITLFIFSIFLFGLPEQSVAGVALGPLGCCSLSGGCTGCQPLETCAIREENCDGVVFAPGDVCVGEFACTSPGDFDGCCVLTEGLCMDDESYGECDSAESLAWFENESCSDVPQCAEPVVSSVPTIAEWGLIALAGILGLVGFMVLKRRKVIA